MTLRQLAPYRDGLLVHEYRVVEVHAGKCPFAKVRVAHWAFRDGRALEVPSAERGDKVRLKLALLSAHPRVASLTIRDTLPDALDMPLLLDVTTVRPDDRPAGRGEPGRLDYACGLTRKMPQFKRLIHQVRLVVLGDSRAQVGVITDRMCGPENRKTPIAYNLAVASSGLDLNETLVYEYLSRAPRLRCVAYALSPRIFSDHWQCPKAKRFRRSAGYRHDKRHADEAFARASPALVTAGQLRSGGRPGGMSLWGWSTARRSRSVGRNPKGKALREITDAFRARENHKFSEDRWRRFRALAGFLQRRGVHLIAFIPPWHPVSAEMPAVDDDGTPRKEYESLVRRLEVLAAELPTLHFHDFHRGGRHDFPSEAFADREHVNEAGARRMTSRLERIRVRLAAWQLVWADEFDYTGLPDPKKWGYEHGFIRNREAQFYTRARTENARVLSVRLLIEARKERFRNPKFDPAARGRNWNTTRAFAEYTSASVTTRGTASWRHARVEVRAKLPTGRGMWPAIWMLGANIAKVGWPACGEIDIMENVGYDPDVIHANVHTAKYNHVRGTNKGARTPLAAPHKDFHLYAVQWGGKRMDFFLDGRRYFTYENEGTGHDVWPFDGRFYLILNIAVGGGWGGRKGIDDSIFPQRMEIDYVRVYQRSSSAAATRPTGPPATRPAD
jgi:beta-glucanase (GH16 family)